MYDQILEKGLTVREVERSAKPSKPGGPSPAPGSKRHERDPNVMALEDAVASRLGAPVHIGDGKIVIDYYSDDDLQRILEVLQVTL